MFVRWNIAAETNCFSGNLTVEKFPMLFWGSNPSENRLILLILGPQIHNLMSIQFSQRLLTGKLGPFLEFSQCGFM